MAMLGMDPDAIEHIAGQLRTQSDQIGQVIAAVEGLINQAEGVWKGNDANQFRDTWQSHYKGPMTQAQHAIADLGTKATQEANQQRQVSGS